jgi:hypothetical protein
MAKDILKEAIADAKAVREVALANAKAALEEAFTPKLQSMLSAKLSEELNESDEDDKEEVGEGYKDPHSSDEDIEFWKQNSEGKMEESENLDEEIDLEEILNELELEEGEVSEEKTIDEADDAEGDEEETLEELESPTPTASEVHNVLDSADHVNEDEEFDLDTLLEEINNLDENEEEDVNEGGRKYNDPHSSDADIDFWKQNSEGVANEGIKDMYNNFVKAVSAANFSGKSGERMDKDELAAYWTPERLADYMEKQQAAGGTYEEGVNETQQAELNEVKAALEVKTTELNEVNLLNSKLLYVNRIFKANTLDDAQKLRVVETLDKAECIKEAKLIYETIKDTFTISKGKKTTPKRSIKEGLGMASKAAGTSTAPKKAVLNESNDMVTRMQKLANITINQ